MRTLLSKQPDASVKSAQSLSYLGANELGSHTPAPVSHGLWVAPGVQKLPGTAGALWSEVRPLNKVCLLAASQRQWGMDTQEELEGSGWASAVSTPLALAHVFLQQP